MSHQIANERKTRKGVTYELDIWHSGGVTGAQIGRWVKAKGKAWRTYKRLWEWKGRDAEEKAWAKWRSL